MSEWVDAIVAFVSAHPHWVGVLVFLVAAGEAVVLIGYLLPGTAILLAVGGLAGLGHVPLMPVLAWAALGAVAGDGLSYWLGRRYGDGLRRRWPFSRYPVLLDRGEAFFHRHGGKSVVLGRFVPVLKPIIPAVAGVLGMPPGRFYVANAISAVLWAPAHVLPGFLVGSSIGLLHGISARLVATAAAVAVTLVVLVWGARVAVIRLAPRAERMHRRAFTWAMARPGGLARRLAAPFDPDHPGTPALLATLALLAGASIAFAKTVEDVVTGDPLVAADHALANLFTGLRNPWTDPIVIAVTATGDAPVIVALAATVLAWLAAVRAWQLAGALALALAAAGAAVAGIKALVQVPRPAALYQGIDAFAFPSGHTTFATVLFGLTAWLIAGGSRPLGRVLVYCAAFGWVLAIALSRLYLGAHWPSDVIGALTLGVLVCAGVAVLYAHAPRAGLRPARLALVFSGVFVLAGAAHLATGFERQLARYAPRVQVLAIDARHWWDTGWRTLPARRVDLAGEPEEALVLQWLGSASALEQRLLAHGWHRPPPWSAANAVRFLHPAARLADLPAPPALHEGTEPVVLLVRAATRAGERWMLRAWRSGFDAAVDGRQVPVLVASIVLQHETHPGAMITLPRTAAEVPPPRALLDGLGASPRRRTDGGSVWLADAAGRFAPRAR